MREHFYRGKTKKGEWIYGSYHYCKGAGKMSRVEWFGGGRNVFHDPVKFNTHWILEHITPTDPGWDVRNTLLPHEVLPETVGQYTGLKDKTGKKIFEGDIYIGERSYMVSRGYKPKKLPNRIKVYCLVEWDLEGAKWLDKELCPLPEFKEANEKAPYDYYHTSLSCEHTKVVGNKYDNPELLPSKRHT